MFFHNNVRPEVDNDVISRKTVDNVAMDVTVEFGVSTSNGFRDRQGADFVSNERTNEQGEAYSSSAKRIPFRRFVYKPYFASSFSFSTLCRAT